MKKKYKRHSEEFKREVVEFAIASPKGIKQICAEFGVSTSQFYDWKKKLLGDEASPGAVGEGESGVTKAEMADEIRALRKENEQLKRQRDILKKAAIILGENPPTSMR